MLKQGEAAPEFELPDSDMELVSLKGYLGRWHVVLFFYPRDGIPQCREEAIGFSDLGEEFERWGAKVIGVSQDEILSHADFCEQYGLSARFLSDVEGEVCRQYDVMHERHLGEHVKMAVERVTYVIDRHGVVRHAVPANNSRHHVTEVLNLVKELEQS
ncbi:MAG: peroxiredoxin [Betaproteobacteria bacterium]|jgi:Peroxiredoxin|nr:peroxiredoxin [Betaproteobacteria bacterium]